MKTKKSDIIAELKSLLGDEKNFIANCANVAAYFYHNLPEVNWAGFYFFDGNELVLGPFSGKPACIRLAIGKGVCGTAALKRETVIVPDVHKFPGHIACDEDSNSEIVLPIIRQSQLLGVFDIDSPVFNRFNDADEVLFKSALDILIAQSDWEIITAIYKK